MDLLAANVERDVVRLREAMNRLMEESVLLPGRFGRPREGQVWRIPSDLLEADDPFSVTALLSGIKPAAVQVSVQDTTVTLQGQTKEDPQVPAGRSHAQERHLSVFRRQVVLPLPIQTELVSATWANGVLTLALPKAEATKPHPIQIQVKHQAEPVEWWHG